MNKQEFLKRKPEYDPEKLLQFCKKNEAPTLFTTLHNAMLPARLDRIAEERRKAIARQTVAIIYMMCYGQSQMCNWFQRDMSDFLYYHGMNDGGLHALHNVGLGQGPRTFYRHATQTSNMHPVRVGEVIRRAVAAKKLMVVIIDDYTNVHTRQGCNETNVAHMATVIVRIFDVPAVSALHDGHPLNDPVGVNIARLVNEFDTTITDTLTSFVNTAPQVVQQQFFNPTNERQRLTTHMYGEHDNIQQLRCVNNAYLIDCVEQSLKSVADYQLAAGVYLQTPVGDYLREHCVVVPGDWPSQFYQRQMAFSPIMQPSLKNTMPSMGPLHVSLNSQENVVLKFLPFFKILYRFLFNKQLANKPKPWRISLMLEVLYGGWTLIREPIVARLGRSKDLQIRTLLNLLDNYTPLTLSIYSILFKANSFDGYFLAMKQVWVMFWVFQRRHYDKAPLVWLSQMLYLRATDHPLYHTIRQNLHITDEYPVENFHSLIRARTNEWDNGQQVQMKARWIDERRHMLHNFCSWFAPPPQKRLRHTQLRHLKVRAARFLLQKLHDICTHQYAAEELARIPGQRRKTTRWRLPQLFGETVVQNSVLPLGYQWEANEELRQILQPGTGQLPPFQPRQQRRCDRTACPDPNSTGDVLLFPCSHSFHRRCVEPFVEFCFVCRTGLLLAVREKAETARKAIFNPEANEGAGNNGDDEIGGNDDGEAPDNNLNNLGDIAVENVPDMNDVQAAVNIQALHDQAANLPAIALL